MSVEKTIHEQEEASRMEGALMRAYELSWMSVIGWEREDFCKTVVRPALYPEQFTLSPIDVPGPLEGPVLLVESIDDFKEDLTLALLDLESRGHLEPDFLHRIQERLGWVAAHSGDTAVIDFPTERITPPSEAPTDRNAEIFYLV